MKAVTVREMKRRHSANRFATARALPLRHTLAMKPVPKAFQFAPGKPRRLAGPRTRTAPARAIIWRGVRPKPVLRARLGQYVYAD